MMSHTHTIISFFNFFFVANLKFKLSKRKDFQMKTSYFSTIQLHLFTVENFVSLVSLSSQVFINRLAYTFSYGEKEERRNKAYTR